MQNLHAGSYFFPSRLVLVPFGGNNVSSNRRRGCPFVGCGPGKESSLDSLSAGDVEREGGG